MNFSRNRRFSFNFAKLNLYYVGMICDRDGQNQKSGITFLFEIFEFGKNGKTNALFTIYYEL